MLALRFLCTVIAVINAFFRVTPVSYACHRLMLSAGSANEASGANEVPSEDVFSPEITHLPVLPSLSPFVDSLPSVSLAIEYEPESWYSLAMGLEILDSSPRWSGSSCANEEDSRWSTPVTGTSLFEDKLDSTPTVSLAIWQENSDGYDGAMVIAFLVALALVGAFISFQQWDECTSFNEPAAAPAIMDALACALEAIQAVAPAPATPFACATSSSPRPTTPSAVPESAPPAEPLSQDEVKARLASLAPTKMVGGARQKARRRRTKAK